MAVASSVQRASLYINALPSGWQFRPVSNNVADVPSTAIACTCPGSIRFVSCDTTCFKDVHHSCGWLMSAAAENSRADSATVVPRLSMAIARQPLVPMSMPMESDFAGLFPLMRSVIKSGIRCRGSGQRDRGWRGPIIGTMLYNDRGIDTTADIEFGRNPHITGAAGGDQVVEDAIRDRLMEGALITE